MNTLLYALSALLAVLSAAFVVASARIFAAQQHKAIKDEERFIYTQGAMESIGGDLKSLHGKFDTTLIPRLDAVYGQLTAQTRTPGLSDLKSALQNLNINYQVASAEGDVFFIGLQIQRFKVSNFIAFHAAQSAIAFRSFAFSINQTSLPLYFDLLTFNAMTPVASVGLVQLTDKLVIVADHFLPVWAGTLSSEAIHRLLLSLAAAQVQIASILDRHNAGRNEILGDQYLAALPADSQGRKIFSIGANPDEIQAWVKPPASPQTSAKHS